MTRCPKCATRPRPEGTTTKTVNGVTHVSATCADLAVRGMVTVTKSKTWGDRR